MNARNGGKIGRLEIEDQGYEGAIVQSIGVQDAMGIMQSYGRRRCMLQASNPNDVHPRSFKQLMSH